MKSGQSRKGSALESAINIIVGYGIAVLSQVIIFPFFGIHLPLSSNLLIGLVFTLVSFVRSYLLRRLFNAAHRRGYFVES